MRHNDQEAPRTRDWVAFSTFLGGIGAVGVVGVADYLSGAQLAFSFFYLVPITFVSWKAGRDAGLVLAVVSAVAYPLTDSLVLGRFSSGWIPLWNFSVRAATFISVVVLASSLRDALTRERELARLDAMTGLSNSRWFTERATAEIARVRAAGEPLTLVYMDLDNFKSVNDDHGHAAGDALLREVGRIFKAFTRTDDLVGRLGGDEFALCLSGKDEHRSMLIVDRITAALTQHAKQNDLRVSFSIGVVTSLTATESVDQLVWFADHLMYAAKSSGKATVRTRTLGEAGAPAELDAPEGALAVERSGIGG